MPTIVKVLSSEFNAITQRIVKVLRFGKSDVLTALEARPAGIDSNPIKDMVAIYAETSEKGKTVIVGYLDRNQLAEPGETRFYSQNSSGVTQFYVWLKADGTCHMGGDADNAVRYAALNTAMQNFKTAINTELVKIQTGLVGVGGAYAHAPVSVNITAAKIDEVKTT